MKNNLGKNEGYFGGYGKYIAGATVGVVALPVTLTAAGFTAGGIAVGSIAAATQSAVYGGATTGEVKSLFNP
jgi:hypothetical protein